MAGKLYWRYKKDGKWTWKPAEIIKRVDGIHPSLTLVKKLEEEE